MLEVIEYKNSFDEHAKKIVNAIGDPTKINDIRGWIGDCRHFANKAYENAMSILKNGEKIMVKGSGGNLISLTQSDIEKWYGNQMNWLIRAERENENTAKK